MADIAYIVQSGDKSRWLWKYWEYFYRKWWTPSTDVEIVFIAESSPPNIPGVAAMESGPGPWGLTVKNAIGKLPHRHVILTHEDYVFNGVVHLDKVLQIRDVMDAHGLDLVKICGNWSGHMSAEYPMEESDIPVGDERLWKYHNKSMYLTSQQPSVWVREFLISTIADGDSPWGHELDGTVRLSQREPPARIYSYRGEQPIPYAEMSTAGGVRPGSERFFTEVDGGQV